MSNEDSFQQLLGDDNVTPVKSEKRVVINPGKIDSRTLEERRHAAAALDVVTSDPLAGEPLVMLEPLSLVSFKRPGIQNGVFRNLRLGKYNIDARLDLHGLSAEKARREVYRYVQDCMASDVRVALITHGKGQGREHPALLKSFVVCWLEQLDEVLAFHTALKHHGGYGSTYVLLRKSDKKKQETREKHSRRD